MSASMPAAISMNPAAVKRRDWSVISLVGAAHACSHFFQLVLPTLYLSLAAEFGYDFAQLGLLASIFFLLSSVGQASSGFIVDRIGPAPVLHFGLACFVGSGLLIAGANGYLMLCLAAALGGIGNSVFHPVDFSILNDRVSPTRLGHAFSAHGLTGNLGWALAPLYIATFIQLTDWRGAAVAASVLVGLVLLATWLGRDMLSGRRESEALKQAAPTSVEADDGPKAPATAAAAERVDDLSRQSVGQTLQTLLVQPALWGAFLFFTFTSIAFSVTQNFTIPILGALYGVDKVLAGSALSAYMLAGAVGMGLGGFLVSSTPRTEFIVLASLVAAAVCFVLLASGLLGSASAVFAVAMAGLCSGVAGPSRDMLIRRVAPKGATGTVYGLVYSGMDIGSSLGPVAFGLMLDLGLLQGPWAGAALSYVLAGLIAMAVGRSAAARRA
ncbi:MAG TPA: MFS transporter [Burkholderiaceae bacterium]|nr:MFS transporter [Burkholderiaceae bacterium]